MKSLALILALTVVGSTVGLQAHASTQTFAMVGSSIEATTFANPTGTFFDTLDFSVAGPGQLNVTLSDLALTQTVNGNATVVFGDLSLTGNLYNNFHPNGTEQLGSLGTFNQTFSFLLPTAGDYHLDFSGDAVGSSGGVYGVALSVSAVPEPETYALMLAGLGALVFMGRRRSAR